MYNILVTGANGQLGSEIKELSKEYEYNFFFAGINDLDITNQENLKSFVDDNRIEVIINCAAYTSVDMAVDDKENANLINNTAVSYLAQI